MWNGGGGGDEIVTGVGNEPLCIYTPDLLDLGQLTSLDAKQATINMAFSRTRTADEYILQTDSLPSRRKTINYETTSAVYSRLTKKNRAVYFFNILGVK